MIIVEPMLGLCNRIRVIDSVLALNRERKHSVRLLWLRDPDLNCRFDELFERPKGIDGVFDFAIGTPAGRILKYLLPRVVQNLASRAIHQPEMERLLAGKYDFSALLPLRSLYIRSWDRFYPGHSPLTEFRPVPELQNRVAACAINRGTAGVHIRRTDNQWRDESPTDKFVHLMEEEIGQRPNADFFVATDSIEEEANLKRLFPGRIISHTKKSLDRNSPAGIKDAMVDLFCLARCGKIIGSHRSSFSETASQIGNCPLIIARETHQVRQFVK
jgi:hypothetical protein